MAAGLTRTRGSASGTRAALVRNLVLTVVDLTRGSLTEASVPGLHVGCQMTHPAGHHMGVDLEEERGLTKDEARDTENGDKTRF